MRVQSILITFFIFLFSFLAFNFIYPQFLRIPFIPEKSFKLGLDLAGGVHLVYQADLSQIEEKDRGKVMDGLKEIIERRINLFGVREPLVQIQGERLIIELSGTIDPAQAIKEIGKTPYLEFREEKENFQEIIEKIKKGESSEDPFKPTPLTGRYLKRAALAFDNVSRPVVSLEFDEEGTKIFEELTEKNLGKILAIYIDGVPISTPVVQEKISGGRAQISGNFTVAQAKELAQNLSAGALPAPIELISQQSVGPILGKISLEKSLKAGIFGFLAVVLFMILFYRLAGLLASLALIVYVIIVLTLFKLIPVTLTLAGIGGFILSIGMAIDANILIFSRMKEEWKEGKDFSMVIKEGFNRAWPAIRDGNLTTLIVAIILFYFGTSFVKGFALTLGLGILVSMFSAIFITKNFLEIFVETKLAKIKPLWL
jgi:protein-export membrane protein SecD